VPERNERQITGVCRFAIRREYLDNSVVKALRNATANKNWIALRRLDMPLTPAVADAPLVASRHVGKRITLYARGLLSSRGI